MDQLSAASAREGCALLIDCRSLESRDVPIPPDARILVFDSGVRRELAASAYNDRRAACERVVAALHAQHALPCFQVTSDQPFEDLVLEVFRSGGILR